MSGFGVILNPHARGNRRARERVARFQSILGDAGEAVATDDVAALDRALARFRERDIEVLGVCGGDGSVGTVVSRALEVWNGDAFPLLLPLRGGTINNLSHAIRSSRDCERMLAHVVAEHARGGTHDTAYADLMLVNGRHYGYTVGAGMIVSFLSLYYAGRRPGRPRALWLFARLGISNLFGTELIRSVATPIEARVTADGETLPFTRYTMLLVSSIANIGLGLRPFYMSGRKPGFFHVLAGPSTPTELLTRLWRFHRGYPANLPTLHDNVASRIRIEFAEPQPFTINGDILAEPTKVLEIEAGPRVKFIRG